MTAMRLGIAMTAIQFSIGILNDLVDAPRDGGRVPPKPIPAGLVARRSAAAAAAGAAALGLGLAAVSDPWTLGIAVLGAACGYAYDLRLSRTPLAWLPLALALPLVPAYAWQGATGSIPSALADLIPIGFIAGAGLAIGNALADAAADARRGIPSIAVRLGRGRAWAIHAAALGVAAAAVAASVAGSGSGAGGPAAPVVAAGSVTLACGAVLLLPGSARRLRAGWALEALGIAGLGIGWLLAAGTTIRPG
ncbi:MAG: UbiA family prenyltransferase [Chloroflexi bacterium]|nr:UbiA family prenyltransferase [Chloroflexota bacterium]